MRVQQKKRKKWIIKFIKINLIKYYNLFDLNLLLEV